MIVAGNSSPRTVLAILFLVNNFHYILKNIRSSPRLLRIVGEALETHVEKRMRDEIDL